MKRALKSGPYHSPEQFREHYLKTYNRFMKFWTYQNNKGKPTEPWVNVE